MRTFIAIEFDDAIRQRLVQAQERLREAGCEVRWARAEQMHLTVKFLGEIDPATVGAVAEAMAHAAEAVAPFEVEVAGLGAFPPRGAPRVVWAGVEDPGGHVQQLQARLERRLEPLGFERERRAFHPHLTLGRVKDRHGADRLRERIEGQPARRFGRQHIEELVLLQSELKPTGAVYTLLRRQGLGRED